MSQLKQIDRQNKKTDKIIAGKFGSKNFLTNFLAYITGTISGPIISFFKKWIYYSHRNIRFCFLFKIGEAFLGRMSIVFYKEIGFSKGQIAFIKARLVTTVFTLLGGVMAMRAGTIKRVLCWRLMASTNFLFAIWLDRKSNYYDCCYCDDIGGICNSSICCIHCWLIEHM